MTPLANSNPCYCSAASRWQSAFTTSAPQVSQHCVQQQRWRQRGGAWLGPGWGLAHLFLRGLRSDGRPEETQKRGFELACSALGKIVVGGLARGEWLNMPAGGQWQCLT